jgi:2-polyprenyl-3-methyl-5-hydroxy-6-metoxy-1,4-benzoquinol methylase
MSEATIQEYDDKLIALLEGLWGEGFMSPGGTAEVDRYLDGIDLSKLSVLDIGCGLGGVDLHLAREHGAARVIGIDIDPALIERCNQLAEKYQATEQLQFRCVEPGPLVFEAASFDIVTSKDSIIHIADKYELARDIFRILEPGGWFVASDWLAGYENQPSAEMQAYLEAEGLGFDLASAATYSAALQAAGFGDIGIVDRHQWYQQQAHVERVQLGGLLYAGLESIVGTQFLEQEIKVWDKMIVALDQGQLRPTHLRARKPLAP